MSPGLKPGVYHTAAGSVVRIPARGKIEIDFDWLEEGACCIVAEPFVADGKLVWFCDNCDASGSAKLRPKITDAEALVLVLRAWESERKRCWSGMENEAENQKHSPTAHRRG